MKKCLVTGVSGFIARALVAALRDSWTVIGIGRQSGEAGVISVRGDFASAEDLHRLDDHEIDAVIHLAAVTGNGAERELFEVNVLGTRNLLRYALDRGCRRFVLASSCAAVGMQNTRFRPAFLPMNEQHPCLDTQGYGFSKFLMEQLADFYTRQVSDCTMVSLRLAAIYDEHSPPPLLQPGPVFEWAAGSASMMSRRDAVRALTMSLHAPLPHGHHVFNALSPRAWVAEPTAEILRSWYGEDFDVTHYLQPQHRWDSLYDSSAIHRAIGFVAHDFPPRQSD